MRNTSHLIPATTKKKMSSVIKDLPHWGQLRAAPFDVVVFSKMEWPLSAL